MTGTDTVVEEKGSQRKVIERKSAGGKLRNEIAPLASPGRGPRRENTSGYAGKGEVKKRKKKRSRIRRAERTRGKPTLEPGNHNAESTFVTGTKDIMQKFLQAFHGGKDRIHNRGSDQCSGKRTRSTEHKKHMANFLKRKRKTFVEGWLFQQGKIVETHIETKRTLHRTYERTRGKPVSRY